MGDLKISGPAIMAILFVVVGFVLNIIGFSVPHWTSTPLTNSGLWVYCFFDSCDQWTKSVIDKTLEAVRGFEIIGLLASVVTIIFTVLYTCISKCSGNKIIGIITLLAALGTAVTIEIGVIMFGTDRQNLAYGFWLSAAGGASYGIAGILFIASLCR